MTGPRFTKLLAVAVETRQLHAECLRIDREWRASCATATFDDAKRGVENMTAATRRFRDHIVDHAPGMASFLALTLPALTEWRAAQEYEARLLAAVEDGHPQRLALEAATARATSAAQSLAAALDSFASAPEAP